MAMRALVGLLCGLLIAAEACGEVAPPVQVMVLGTYHMDNPGVDTSTGWSTWRTTRPGSK
jgi:hypothetical protein